MFRFVVLFLVCNVFARVWQFIGKYFICWVSCLFLYLLTGIYLCNPIVVLALSIALNAVRPRKRKVRYF